MPGRYAVAKYWSIAHACKVTRVSLTDDHGAEHHATVPHRELLAARIGEDGRPMRYRENLNALLDRLQDSIDAGEPAGEAMFAQEAARVDAARRNRKVNKEMINGALFVWPDLT